MSGSGLETEDEMIERICLENGFSLKRQDDGTMALNPYVFAAARALLAAGAEREKSSTRTPSRFQLRDRVSVEGENAVVTEVSFALMDFNDGWGEGGKISYVVRFDKTGRSLKVLSNYVEPPVEERPRLSVVK